ncbi:MULTISPECIES: esterase/lipase family protein [Microbispora]|uniref:Alpha/beta fold hydrolase n=1 Tax=Microbispora catharanthi TaxID=1712871 RepID=A0A5N6BXY0_9ACTN|nr:MULTISPECIES: alpha/beta fold hydrolase [Microbispora]KAB8185342.1 alpha/beta fold hydrolase [Microbispora catharanthi]GLX07164.1 lipase [Microbispora sp. NBRC 16548]
MRRIVGPLIGILALLGFFAPAAPAQAATHNPVVFVHGYTGNSTNFATLQAYLVANGWSAGRLYGYNYNWAGSNVISAQGLAAFVNQIKASTGASKVDIVNHSMGGLVTRYYLQKLGGAANVDHVASLAGANHGTTYASACTINISCIEMLPGSAYIVSLSGDETPGSAKYGTWVSPCDGIIIPYTSTRLSGADNHTLACVDHLSILSNIQAMSGIRDLLNS